MQKRRRAKVHSIKWNSYDNIYQITWKINGRLTNNFSTRGKRIGFKVSPYLRKEEAIEAMERGDVVVDYINGTISRKKAIERLQQLRFLCPKNPTAHLATMLEFTLGLR